MGAASFWFLFACWCGLAVINALLLRTNARLRRALRESTITLRRLNGGATMPPVSSGTSPATWTVGGIQTPAGTFRSNGSLGTALEAGATPRTLHLLSSATARGSSGTSEGGNRG